MDSTPHRATIFILLLGYEELSDEETRVRHSLRGSRFRWLIPRLVDSFLDFGSRVYMVTVDNGCLIRRDASPLVLNIWYANQGTASTSRKRTIIRS